VVRLLGAILRLAEGLDRSHAQVVSGLAGVREKKGWLIRLHSAGDLELEVWAAGRHAAPLAALLDSEIRFAVVKPPEQVVSEEPA
jgi:exopolyphosphatase/guanosine-5'-triphosphate,3'-diphosphate pyrophosphatase